MALSRSGIALAVLLCLAALSSCPWASAHAWPAIGAKPVPTTPYATGAPAHASALPAFGLASRTPIVIGPRGEFPDEYEEDDTPAGATTTYVNAPDQSRGFHEDADEDWVRFEAYAGEIVTIETLNLGPIADTYLELFRESDLATPILANDDRGPSDLSSVFFWDVDADGVYYVRVSSAPLAAPPYSGAGADYDLRIWNESGPDDVYAGRAAVELTALNSDADELDSFTLAATSPDNETYRRVDNPFGWTWHEDDTDFAGEAFAPGYRAASVTVNNVDVDEKVDKDVTLLKEAVVDAAPLTASAGPEAGTVAITINNGDMVEGDGVNAGEVDLKWAAAVTTGAAWASVSPPSGIIAPGADPATLTITLAPNASNAPRQAVVEITNSAYGEDDGQTVTIDQGADTVPPVVTLLGSAAIVLAPGQPYVEPGATAYDTVDGDLTSALVQSGDAVDTSAVGTYVVVWSATDAAGNTGSATRTVTVSTEQLPVHGAWLLPLLGMLGVAGVWKYRHRT